MKKPKLSAVLTVLNEEHRILHQHLKNLKTFCDEIIITVDTKSTDNTFNICKEYTDKVFYHEWDSNNMSMEADPLFAGIKHISGDWYLLIDSDMLCSQLLIGEIFDRIISEEHVAYEIPCCNFIFGKWFTHKEHWHSHFHLFKKDYVDYYRTDFHNRNYKFKGTTGKLTNPLLHYGVPDIDYFIKALNRYTSVDATKILVSGKGGAFNRKFGEINMEELRKGVFETLRTHYHDLNYYKENEHGFIFSALMAIYYFVENAKVYEQQWKKKNPWVYGELGDIEAIAQTIANQLQQANERNNEFMRKRKRDKFRKLKNVIIGLTPPYLYQVAKKVIA